MKIEVHNVKKKNKNEKFIRIVPKNSVVLQKLFESAMVLKPIKAGREKQTSENMYVTFKETVGT